MQPKPFIVLRFQLSYVPIVEDASFFDRYVAFMWRNVFVFEKLLVLSIKETKMR
jgi:hypothetical protein